MNAIEARNISKYYALSDSQLTRLRRIFSPVYQAPDESHKRAGRDLCALRDVSFSVPQGEALGIVGANGSGKSTLLQIVTGILRPTSGSVEINGRCSALLELGSGFAPEFSGRQNVFLNGTILGLSEDEIAAKFDAIHRFSGIGDFIDQPIRTYSTGMVLRLAFAVVAHSEPRILIVDEALAVGDIAFRQRCMRRIHEMRADGVTILFVSHDAGDVKALCERCLWLDHGQVRALGEADEVVTRYLASTVDRTAPEKSRTNPVAVATEPVNEPAHAIRGACQGNLSFRQRRGRSHRSQRCRFFPRRSLAQNARAGESPCQRADRGLPGTQRKRQRPSSERIPRERIIPSRHWNPAKSLRAVFLMTLPGLAPGNYSVTIAIADGNITEYEVCDYVRTPLRFR